MIPERDKATIRDRFAASLVHPIQIDLYLRPESGLFLPGRQPSTSKETRQLLEELAGCSDLITLNVVDVTVDAKAAEALEIVNLPAIVLRGPDDGRLRMLGIPAGYEFATLIETIVVLSTGDPAIGGDVVEILDNLEDPIDIQVFVTPT